MELTHKDIQKLHAEVRNWKIEPEGKKLFTKDNQQYEIINSENSVTEAVAVAPVV
ncbi:hypothetical protein STRDD11_01207 [Streptococcus sp. DD11]|uniref:hypothetical protein n=1 Tax=Streptococcus sp. DD11 TaxID=1777879 RepID=UPI0007992881|nr:hypothetical protein [Streptococcus sp. DD11]KXT83954.1 hypothetical protein STRDD11_01207 [Streptococcus sp. DD11]